LAELSFSIRVARSLAAAMKRKRCQVTALQSTRLDVIRLIRAIRGLNILSFQLQNHSTSLMPTRRVGLQQPVYSFSSVTIRVLRFIRVLLLPNNSTTQLVVARYSSFSAPPRRCVRIIHVVCVIQGANASLARGRGLLFHEINEKEDRFDHR